MEQRPRVIALAVTMGLVLGAAGIAAVALLDDDRPQVLTVATGAGLAGGERAAVGAPDAAMAPFGRVEYRYVGPRPDLPGSARAYRLGGEVTEARVRDLGRALGLTGDVQTMGEGSFSSFVLTDDAHVLSVSGAYGPMWSFTTVQDGCLPKDVPPGMDEVSCTFSVTGSAGPDQTVPADEGQGRGQVDAGSAEGCPPEETCPAPPPPSSGSTVFTCRCLAAPCPEGQECPETEASCPPPPPSPEPVPPPGPPRPANRPSKAEAERVARDLFARTGLDLDEAKVGVDDGLSVWLVHAEAVIDGQPVQGLGWSAAIGEGGKVEFANGFLGHPEAADTYPLVGVDEAVRRLNRLGQGMGPYLGAPAMGRAEAVAGDMGVGMASGSGESVACAAPMPPAEGEGASSGSGSSGVSGGVEPSPPVTVSDCPPEADCVVTLPAPGPVPAPEPGPPPEPVVVELTGVRLGLVAMPSTEEGELLIVPAYLFEVEGQAGADLPVPAVEDRFLPKALVSPVPDPVPLPAKPEPDR